MIAVDTSAVMAALMREDRADGIIQVMAENNLCMSAGTLSELMTVATARGLEAEVEEIITSAAIEVTVVDGAVAKQVQESWVKWGKGRHKASLNFGDCFAYALAKQRDIPLLFVGNDFSETDVKLAIL